ncbi:hypothetical protein CB0940_10997 [Cercospora beticola]|uniref:Uncharacterized protein n=1 Tax=Cercospora beticola TaxID=122368 RepID=A0A2G5HCR1_CERBT|nr:hypothetical protein CB0940_10997 [Cercospora beticola]PIA90330.1 hypothetical protein CB0940_10997 [Cercospora beticola]WPB07821.1 hypothetical protein RHO25_012485 [Cercospora beticola]
MAGKLRCVNTKKSINVSQDYDTSPAPVANPQRPVRTSSDKSNASLIFSQTRSATSQTEATTSAMKGAKLKAPLAKQGSAVERLKARRSLSATQEADNNDSAERPVQAKAISSADPAPKPATTDDTINKQGQRQSLRLLQKDEGSELRPAGPSHDGEPGEQEVVEQSEKKQNSPNVLPAGSTQDNAIDLSDDNESSPPPEQSPVVEQAPPVPRGAPPKTPAVKSSPPNAAKWDEADDRDLFGMMERSTRKANIINFSKSGPRNQGVSKHRTPRPRNAKGAPSSRHGRSSGSPLKKRYLEKQKEPVIGASTQHCAGAAQPKSSNVADNLSQAMRELYPKPPKHAEQMFVDSKELQQTAAPPQVTGGPSKSQLSRKPIGPSPPRPTTVVADSLPQEDQDYEGDTLVDCDAPGDKVASPPHAIEKPVPTVIADVAPTVEAAEKPRLKMSAPAVIADVAAPVEAAEKPKLKRSAPVVAEPSKRAKKQIKPADLGTVVDPPRILTAGKAPVPRDADRKQTRARRLASKPTRNASQASQTVDLNGSPVPEGMNMKNSEEAVLDAYSRQSLGESGKPTRRGHDTPGMDDAVDDIGGGNAYTAPLSHQPEIPHLMSSNMKAVPASPRAESTALTSFKASPTLSRKMLEKRDSIGGLHDPFTKSKAQTEDAIASPMTNLEGILSRHPYQSFTRPPRDTAVAHGLLDAEDDDADSSTEREEEAEFSSVQKPKVEAFASRKVAGSKISATAAHVEPLPASLMPSMAQSDVARPKKLPNPKKVATPSRGRSIARELGQQIYDFQGSATAVAEEEQSLGATLVAHEDSMKEQFERIHKISRPTAAFSRATTREPQELNDAEEWALSLKPRQLSLVNQMVECVQQLTQYMFDQERGTEEMLEEYHRRNLYLIEQEEKQQVKKYRQMQRDLVLRKKDKFGEAELYHRNLVRRFEEFERETSQYERRKAVWEAGNEEIEAFIMDHS